MITLQLTEQQLQIIGRALGEMPFNMVAALVNEITKQVTEQTQVKEE